MEPNCVQGGSCWCQGTVCQHVRRDGRFDPDSSDVRPVLSHRSTVTARPSELGENQASTRSRDASAPPDWRPPFSKGRGGRQVRSTPFKTHHGPSEGCVARRLVERPSRRCVNSFARIKYSTVYRPRGWTVLCAREKLSSDYHSSCGPSLGLVLSFFLHARMTPLYVQLYIRHYLFFTFSCTNSSRVYDVGPRGSCSALS